MKAWDCGWQPFGKIGKLSLSLATILTLSCVGTASAHVKWFSRYDYTQLPQQLHQITRPIFWLMMAIALVTLLIAVLTDKWLEKQPWAERVCNWFEAKQGTSLLVMRVAAFATLIVAWQQGTVLTPELAHDSIWLERLQFIVLLLLLFPKTTTFAGIGFLCLWIYGAAEYGWFHMLDYVNLLGVAYFFIVRPFSGTWWRETALPVLYATVGFSLMWLGCEKLTYPQWALYLLEQHPILSLGLPAKFFLVGAAFVELGLGFMLLICLFSRSLSVTITLVFFLTSCIFGKVEIIGHTLLHASLIVFLFEGPGHSFTPPAWLHRTTFMRAAFATVNFVIVVMAMLFAYTNSARLLKAPTAHVHPRIEVTASELAPRVALSIKRDPKSGWNLLLETENFTFAPDEVGEGNNEHIGHAHLYLDDQKIARIYGNWHYLPELPSGEHVLRVTLNTNEHFDICVDGHVVSDELLIADELSEQIVADVGRRPKILTDGVCAGASR